MQKNMMLLYSILTVFNMSRLKDLKCILSFNNIWD